MTTQPPLRIGDLVSPALLRPLPELAALCPGEMAIEHWLALWTSLAAQPTLLLIDAIPSLAGLDDTPVDALELGLRDRNFLHAARCETLGDIGARPAASFELWPSASKRLLASLTRSLCIFLARQPCAASALPLEDLPLPTVEQATEGMETLDELLVRVSDSADGEIFLARLPRRNGRRPETLQALADANGVTRERIRQREVRGRRELDLYLREPGPLRQSLDRIKADVGSAYPVDSVVQLPAFALIADTNGFSHESHEWRLFLHALSCQEREDWVVADLSFVPCARSLQAWCPEVDGVFGLISEVVSAIRSAGVPATVVARWLEAAPDLSLFEDHVVHWPVSNLRARARAVLAVRGRPMDIDDLLGEVRPNAEVTRGERNGLLGALTRVSMSEVALPEWNLDPYEGLSVEIQKWVEAAPNQILPLDSLVEEIVSAFGAAPASVRSYVSSNPSLISEHGMVRFVDGADDGSLDAAASAAWDRDVFAGDDDGSYLWLVCVDTDVQRGSGRLFPRGLFAELGLRRGGRAALRVGDLEVAVGWHETGPSPTIGSLRRVALSVGADIDDVLVLRIDRTLETAAYRVRGIAGVEDTRRFVREVLLATEQDEEAPSLLARRSFLPATAEAAADLRHLAENSSSADARHLVRLLTESAGGG